MTHSKSGTLKGTGSPCHYIPYLVEDGPLCRHRIRATRVIFDNLAHFNFIIIMCNLFFPSLSSDRFHLIIPEIGILSSRNQVSEFVLPFYHLYQACSGPGLREVPVDTFRLSGSRKICISFGNLEDENGKTEITSTSACEVACTSARRLGHQARAGFD